MADTTDQGWTALIIAVPEAEEAVREWRLSYDPSAAEGVPAHITVLFPFLPPARIDAPVLAALRGLFAACPPIPFTLARVGRFEQVVYLAPEPAEPFKELVRRVLHRYPECPPYGGEVQVEDLMPHLTAAHTADQSALDKATEELTPCLPIAALAREVWLTEKPEGGRWRTRAVFPLGGAR